MNTFKRKDHTHVPAHGRGCLCVYCNQQPMRQQALLFDPVRRPSISKRKINAHLRAITEE